ncbi:tol-pal system YbgF family protein [candidate division KSB1 bacterium]
MKLSVIVLLTALLFSCSQYQPGSDISMEKQSLYASALLNQKLYRQSLVEFEKLLRWYKLDESKRANVNYTMGDIYFTNLSDYQNALAHFLKIKHVFDDSKLMDETNKKIIACLERLGRYSEASQVLKESTGLGETMSEDSPFERVPGDTVAVIDGFVYTSGELDNLFSYYYNALPEDQKGDGPTRDMKINFIRDYIRTEVLYNSAKKQNLDQDQQVLEVAFLQKKTLMVEKLIRNGMEQVIQVAESEIVEYYEANKDKIVETKEDGTQVPATFEAAHNTIHNIIYTQKVQSYKEQLTDRLIQEQNAQIFAEKIK